MSAAPSVPKPLPAPGRALDDVSIGPISALETALCSSAADAKLALTAANTQLDDLASRIRRALAAGADTAAYSRLNAIMGAIAAAKEILVMAETSPRHDERM